MQNATFEKAAALLVHPISLAAMALMMVNDQVLRRFWPSWWTGKFSDFGWLTFAPFLAAALLAWIVPMRVRNHSKWVGILAFGFVGLAFSLGKTLPIFHEFILQILRPLLTAPSIVLDPTDLIALPMLLLSGWLWARPRPIPALRASRWGLAALPFAVMLTVANSAAPNYGISCLTTADGTIFANGTYNTFSSSDGGFTWSAVTGEQSAPVCRDANLFGEADWREVQNVKDGLHFKYKAGEDIQVSRDGGKNWQVGYHVNHITQANLSYLMKTQTGNPSYIPGPLAAVEDPKTGNTVFAMGQEGALVYTPSGRWQWSQIGPFLHFEGAPNTDILMTLLSGELLLGLGAVLLVFILLVQKWLFVRKWAYAVRAGLIALAFFAWLGVVLVFPPAMSSSYTLAGTELGTLIAAVLLVPLAIESTLQLARHEPRVIPLLAAVSLLAGVLFFIPYLLWAYNGLPQYSTAQIFGLAMPTAVLIIGYLLLLARESRNYSASL